MSVISRGKVIAVLGASHPKRPTNTWQQKQIQVQHAPRRTISVYGPVCVARLESELQVVREHFGCNVSDAFKIALHLTARAIQKNKAFPEIA
jgi:hypothetical protein